jgi:hypothetical protein
VVTVPSARETTATDQAQRAAHCARLLQASAFRPPWCWPPAALALDGELPIGEVLAAR